MVRETTLAPHHLILPLFVQAGQNLETPIASMPGQARLSIDRLVEKAREAARLGVRGVELFPAIDNSLKDPRGRESQNPDGLLQRAIRELKKNVPELCVFTDVALNPVLVPRGTTVCCSTVNRQRRHAAASGRHGGRGKRAPERMRRAIRHDGWSGGRHP